MVCAKKIAYTEQVSPATYPVSRLNLRTAFGGVDSCFHFIGFTFLASLPSGSSPSAAGPQRRRSNARAKPAVSATGLELGGQHRTASEERLHRCLRQCSRCCSTRFRVIEDC